MANVLVDENSLSDIADAIRSKKGVSTTYKPSEMADAISSISGGITPSGTKTINITQNGTVTEDVTSYASAQVNVTVPNPSTGTKTITTNGTHDVTDYASAQVNVPNSYTQSDEGKVVVNGSLASQTSQSITVNGTYDTTMKNSVTVNVPNPSSGSQTFTENGTYDVTSLAEAVVAVPSTGAEYYKGTIEFTDESATTLTLPVGVGNTDEFLLEFYLSKTGTVSGGVVTKDNVLTKHYTAGQWVVSGYAKRRLPTALVTPSGNKVISYGYITYAVQGTNNGTSDLNVNAASGMTLGANSIVLNVSKELCGSGVYNEYTYHLFVSRGTR